VSSIAAASTAEVSVEYIAGLPPKLETVMMVAFAQKTSTANVEVRKSFLNMVYRLIGLCKDYSVRVFAASKLNPQVF